MKYFLIIASLVLLVGCTENQEAEVVSTEIAEVVTDTSSSAIQSHDAQESVVSQPDSALQKEDSIQGFELAPVDMDVILAEEKGDTCTKCRHEREYYYLLSNYALIGEKEALPFNEEKDGEECWFLQNFEQDIQYKQSCFSFGTETSLRFPLLTNAVSKKFVNQLYKREEHEWKSNTTYEPIDQEAGCYVEIKDTNNFTIIKQYCGC